MLDMRFEIKETEDKKFNLYSSGYFNFCYSFQAMSLSLCSSYLSDIISHI
jgi:hypothetical protein